MSSQPTMYICTDLAKYCLFERILKGRKDGKAFNTVPHCTKILTTLAIAAFSWFPAAFFFSPQRSCHDFLSFSKYFFLLDFRQLHLFVLFCALCFFYCCCNLVFDLIFLASAFVQSWNQDEILSAFSALSLQNRTDRIQDGRIMRKCKGTAQRFIYREEFDEEDKSQVFVQVLGCLGLRVSTI